MSCNLTNQSLNYAEIFVPLSYGVLSILVYVLLTFLILRNKKLHQPFYYYFIFLGAMNSILWADLFFLFRLPRMPDLCVFFMTTFNQSSVFLNITIILFTLTSIGQLLVMMLISFSRFLAVVWPTKQQIVPSPTKCILCILVISLACSSVAFSWTAKYVKGADGYPLFKAEQGWPYIAPVYIISPVGAVCSVLVPISTLYAVCILVKGKKQKKNFVELKLLLTSFCFSFSSVCLSIYMIGIFLSRYILKDDDLSAFVAGFREVLLDLATLPAGWLLILTNRDVRSIFTRKKKFLSSQSTF